MHFIKKKEKWKRLKQRDATTLRTMICIKRKIGFNNRRIPNKI